MHSNSSAYILLDVHNEIFHWCTHPQLQQNYFVLSLVTTKLLFVWPPVFSVCMQNSDCNAMKTQYNDVCKFELTLESSPFFPSRSLPLGQSKKHLLSRPEKESDSGRHHPRPIWMVHWVEHFWGLLSWSSEDAVDLCIQVMHHLCFKDAKFRIFCCFRFDLPSKQTLGFV